MEAPCAGECDAVNSAHLICAEFRALALVISWLSGLLLLVIISLLKCHLLCPPFQTSFGSLWE